MTSGKKPQGDSQTELNLSNMDTRKVQVSGKSTYLITLPKNWVVNSGLEAGTVVFISYLDDGSIAITPRINKKRPLIKVLEQGNKDIEDFKRDIIGTYIMGGYQYLEIHADFKSFDFKNEIKGLIQNLIGVEVIETTEFKIVVQELLETERFTIEKGLTRMSAIVYQMISESLSVLKENNYDLIEDVITRDNEVDKMFYLVSKQFINRLSLNKVSKNSSLNLIETFYYRLVAGNIERIGDHATKIVSALERNIPENDVSKLIDTGEASLNLYSESVESFKLSDSKTANEILRKSKDLSKNIIEFEQPATTSTCIVLDSFIRIRNYAENIAELTIDLSQQ
ncbi:MAG: PhoU domain-containing protein [Methanohalobium sp.]|uniref:PhoU domain-containing protein n=1 Tax=Methanohalobium sp. TaxID=2837493 RepID=UPI00397E0684